MAVAPKTSFDLSTLHGATLDSLSLHLDEVGSNRFGARYFQLFLKDRDGRQGQPWVVMGLFHRGSLPAHNWLETMAVNSKISFGDKAITLPRKGIIKPLLQLLANLVPPGGHLMVEYESHLWLESRAQLSSGWPPLLTPLGQLLWDSGCQGGFKDFYFAEGGTKGPRKLAAFKPLNPQQARHAKQKLIAEIETFIAQQPPQPVLRLARRVLRKVTSGGEDDG